VAISYNVGIPEMGSCAGEAVASHATQAWMSLRRGRRSCSRLQVKAQLVAGMHLGDVLGLQIALL